MNYVLYKIDAVVDVPLLQTYGTCNNPNRFICGQQMMGERASRNLLKDQLRFLIAATQGF
jgi:hypothetical protein